MGTVIADRYELLNEVATGPVAVLHRGRMGGASGFSRPVAVRALHAGLARDRRFLGAWAATASELASAGSPHVEQVIDVVIDGDRAYFVSEWISGLSLASWIERHRDADQQVPWPLAVEVAIEILRALRDAHAHAPPLLHDGLGLDTVRIAKDGTVKLTRYGAAAAFAATGHGRRALEDKGLRHPAPELVDGSAPTAATDQFGVGTVLYALLAGRDPFGGPPGAARDMIVSADVPDLSPARPDAPPLLLASMERALRLDPADRFTDVGQMASVLRNLLRTHPEPSGPAVLAASIRALWTTHGKPSSVAPPSNPGAAALAATVRAMMGGAEEEAPRFSKSPRGLTASGTMHVDMDELTDLYEEDQRELEAQERRKREAAEREEGARRAKPAKRVISRDRTKTYQFAYKQRAESTREEPPRAQRIPAARAPEFDDETALAPGGAPAFDDETSHAATHPASGAPDFDDPTVHSPTRRGAASAPTFDDETHHERFRSERARPARLRGGQGAREHEAIRLDSTETDAVDAFAPASHPSHAFEHPLELDSAETSLRESGSIEEGSLEADSIETDLRALDPSPLRSEATAGAAQAEASEELDYDDEPEEAEPLLLTTRAAKPKARPLGLRTSQTEMLDGDALDEMMIGEAPDKRPLGLRTSKTEMLDGDALDEMMIGEAPAPDKRPLGLRTSKTEMLDGDALDELRIDDD